MTAVPLEVKDRVCDQCGSGLSFSTITEQQILGTCRHCGATLLVLRVPQEPPIAEKAGDGGTSVVPGAPRTNAPIPNVRVRPV